MSVLVAVSTVGREAPARTVADRLDFAGSLPGLRDLRHFELAALDESGHLFALRSTERPEVRLFVVPPQPYFPDYAPRIDPSTRASLGIDDDDAVLLVVVHPGNGGEPPTANLLAPMAVNPTTGRAVQVVLDGDDWPLRAPLTAAGSAA